MHRASCIASGGDGVGGYGFAGGEADGELVVAVAVVALEAGGIGGDVVVVVVFTAGVHLLPIVSVWPCITAAMPYEHQLGGA